ncbi:DNA-binding protein Alba [[Eubacterium] cellulosolvens]
MSAIEGNMIRVGKKPVMNYVMACVTLFNSGSNEIIIRARGKAITKAVDIAQMLRRSFTKGLIIKSIKVGSEDIKRMQEEFPISTIEIVLSK